MEGGWLVQWEVVEVRVLDIELEADGEVLAREVDLGEAEDALAVASEDLVHLVELLLLGVIDDLELPVDVDVRTELPDSLRCTLATS